MTTARRQLGLWGADSSEELDSEQDSPDPRVRYRVIDTETTGIDARHDAVVEIAWVDIEDGEVCAEWGSLVAPNMAIPPSASAIHHITDEMVADAPQLAEV